MYGDGIGVYRFFAVHPNVDMLKDLLLGGRNAVASAGFADTLCLLTAINADWDRAFYGQLTSALGTDHGACESAFVPFDIDFESATRPQTAHATLGPEARQRGQQLDRAIVALQQHFGDARCCAEVTIDLEGRVCTEQVGINAATKDRNNIVIG